MKTQLTWEQAQSLRNEAIKARQINQTLRIGKQSSFGPKINFYPVK
jgi:hypothetical protein